MQQRHQNIISTLAELNVHLTNAEELIDELLRRTPTPSLTLGLDVMRDVIHEKADRIEDVIHECNLCSKDFTVLMVQYEHGMDNGTRSKLHAELVKSALAIGAQYISERIVPTTHESNQQQQQQQDTGK